MARLRKRRVLGSVFLVEFPSQYELAATFLRFQEHYESPRFRRRIFSLEQYMDWYAGVKGNFTYYLDWSGFNVPSWVLEPFRAGRFDPLSEKERRLLALLEGEREPFYVIGLAREDGALDRALLEHELAHGLFHTDRAYRRRVQQALREVDTRALERRLLAAGYCRQVLQDEVHAYVLDGADGAARERPQLAALRRRLRLIFRESGGADAAARAAAT